MIETQKTRADTLMLMVLFNAMMMMDLWLTHQHVNAGMRDANPLAAHIYMTWGTPGLTILKCVTTILANIIGFYLLRLRSIWSPVLFGSAACLGLIVIFMWCVHGLLLYKALAEYIDINS